MKAFPSWLMLDTQTILRACSRAWANTGISIDAKMPMMAITTRSSIRVNPSRCGLRITFSLSPMPIHITHYDYTSDQSSRQVYRLFYDYRIYRGNRRAAGNHVTYYGGGGLPGGSGF